MSFMRLLFVKWLCAYIVLKLKPCMLVLILLQYDFSIQYVAREKLLFCTKSYMMVLGRMTKRRE